MSVRSLPSAASLGLSRLLHFDSVASTMDEVHAAAKEGAPAGLLVIADRQRAGRGRGRKSWTSEPGAGLWMTLLERPPDASMLPVLSLRLGLELAAALEPFAHGPIGVKWPNDLYTTIGKLAGILVEARWREQQVDWVAIGLGVNLRVPEDVAGAAALRSDVDRHEVLRAIVPALQAAVHAGANLTSSELGTWQQRDVAANRRITLPVPGIVRGVSSDGALLVLQDGQLQPTRVHAGSMEFAAPAESSTPENPC
ncbi:MAG TPA: biotin--[acetyl-CoA-carboxylase] ligase [Gemmatimonas sp.]|nr:biotin--[acetyl-CoA-carboxylase] ligase [Gemmatimonas sp.]